MFSYHSHFRPLTERRLLNFGVEGPTGPEAIPESRRAPEQQESMNTPEDAAREGTQRTEAADSDMDSVRANLLAPSDDVELTVSPDLRAALDLPMSGDDAPVTPEVSTNTTSEAQEEVPQTPQQKLWEDFTMLASNIENPERTEQLRQAFMAIPTDRAQAMIDVYDDVMVVGDRSRFEEIVIQNSSLLNRFSDTGFNSALALLAASNAEERAAIIAKLPDEDRALVANKDLWPKESSDRIKVFLDAVDAKLRPEEETQESKMTLQEEIAQIENPILRHIIEALVSIFAGDVTGEADGGTNLDMQRKVADGVNTELSNLEGDAREAKRQELLGKANTDKQRLEQEVSLAQSNLEAAMQKQPLDEGEVQQLTAARQEAERKLEEVQVRIAQLEAAKEGAVVVQENTINIEQVQERIAQLQKDLPENEQNFTVGTIDIAGEEKPAIIFNTDKPQGKLYEVFGRQQVVMLSEESLQRVIAELTKETTDS